MTDPISHLGIDILKTIFSLDRGVKSEKEYKFLTSAAGRIYIDISELLQFKIIRKKLPGILKSADALMGEALIQLTRRPDFETRIKRNKPNYKESTFGGGKNTC